MAAEPVVRDLSQVTRVVIVLLLLHGHDLVQHLPLHLFSVAESGTVGGHRAEVVAPFA